MFKSANEMKKISDLNNDESFKLELHDVFKKIESNISSAAEKGAYSTEAYFYRWYIEDNHRVLSKIREELVSSGYKISQWCMNPVGLESFDYFTISWK